MTQISAAAGVSRRTFYAYFSSKEVCYPGPTRRSSTTCGWPPPPPSDARPLRRVAAALLGGMVAVVVRQVSAGEGHALPSLLPDLVEILLAPILCRREAAKASGQLDTI